MTEENKTPQQEYVYNVDQLASVNSFIEIDIDGETVRLQLTSRHNATPEKIAAAALANVEAYKVIRAKYPRPVATVPQPVRVPIDDSGNALPEIKTAVAGRLSIETKDDKVFVKVVDCIFAQGEKGTKYGMNVWPETSEAAGLDLSPGQPLPDISGWRVDYVCNDKGYPSKVTRLLPPKS